MRWLLEPHVFSEGSPHPLAAAVARARHEVTLWEDEWWSNDRLPPPSADPTLFHGSLQNAAKIAYVVQDVARLTARAALPLAMPNPFDIDFIPGDESTHFNPENLFTKTKPIE